MKRNLNLILVTLTLIITLLDCAATARVRLGSCQLVGKDEPCPDPNIQVLLYTRKSPENGEYVQLSEADNLTSSNFDPSLPNKIILHGFTKSIYDEVIQIIKNEYLRQSNVNVFLANYAELVAGPDICYVTAVSNLRHIGMCLAQGITTLRRYQSNDIHVVGFSIGAQLTNFIAKALGEDKIPRITGLDPAGPGFTGQGNESRLDASDALFVDVIHTNGGQLGDIERSGHIDFYVNRGSLQPGCPITNATCNHYRAPMYFAESINSEVGFFGWKCNVSTVGLPLDACEPHYPLVEMGEPCPPGSSGAYLVDTNPEPPYARGDPVQNPVRNSNLRPSNFDSMVISARYYWNLLSTIG